MTIAEVAALEPGNRVILTNRRPTELAYIGNAPMWVDGLWFSTDRRHALVRLRDRAAPTLATRHVSVGPEAIAHPPIGAMWSETREAWISRDGVTVLPRLSA